MPNAIVVLAYANSDDVWGFPVGGGAVNGLQPYVLTIRRLAVLLVVLADLVEVVFVELAHETGEVAMLEVFG